MKKIHTLKIRLSDNDLKRVKFGASRAKLSTADYVRTLALGNQITEKIENNLASETISGLNKAGNLLNQIAAKLNTGKVVDSATVKISIDELDRRIEDIRMKIKATSDDIGGRHDR